MTLVFSFTPVGHAERCRPTSPADPVAGSDLEPLIIYGVSTIVGK